jgi:uncharacterized protein with ATP-grasp and redox domains
MKTALDCLPCLMQQCLKVARMATADEKVHETILRETLWHASQLDLARPPMLGHWIYQQVRQRTGQADPYLAVKQESNRLALALYPTWKQRVLTSENPLKAAVRLAIAANIIDFGINGDSKPEDIPSALEKSFASRLEGDVDGFLDAAGRAKDVLYLADNAGELVFDRLFIELLARNNITVAVKGGPAINDALRVDAEAAGLLGLVEVIDNGTDGAGTLLETCSAEFQQRFERAHLIIAKGQANYETLDGCPREIFFLLKVKCPLVSRHIGRETGSLVIHRNVPATQAMPRPARLSPASEDQFTRQLSQTERIVMTPMGGGTGPLGQGPRIGRGMGPRGGGQRRGWCGTKG